MNTSSVYISAAHKSSGKTIISLALSRAFVRYGFKVQTFKKGPDYIDPIWLQFASQNPCYNLDFYTMSNSNIIDMYKKFSSQADISIIEGNKGLFDGLSVDGKDSNAELAKKLKTAVILVIDATGITRGAAPLTKGYQNFDKNIKFKGVILNKVQGQRHEDKLIKAINYYTDMPVLGAVRKSAGLIIKERHLGLMPANEAFESNKIIDDISKKIEAEIDLNKIFPLTTIKNKENKIAKKNNKYNLKIALAKDSAFGFYYQDDLDTFNKLGAEIIYFDTLKADKLPAVDGLFLGGGFPETHLKYLAKNTSLKNDIKNKILSGLPTYAECGGLMYLTNSIIKNNKNYKMLGVIDADTIITKKPIGRGYVKLKPINNHLWVGGEDINGHEFHYSKLENINSQYKFAFEVKRGAGIKDNKDGILAYNLLATYSHLRNINSNWVVNFLNFIKLK